MEVFRDHRRKQPRKFNNFSKPSKHPQHNYNTRQQIQNDYKQGKKTLQNWSKKGGPVEEISQEEIQNTLKNVKMNDQRRIMINERRNTNPRNEFGRLFFQDTIDRSRSRSRVNNRMNNIVLPLNQFQTFAPQQAPGGFVQLPPDGQRPPQRFHPHPPHILNVANGPFNHFAAPSPVLPAFQQIPNFSGPPPPQFNVSRVPLYPMGITMGNMNGRRE